ncbi:translation initiation factor IF-3 [Haloferula rosea]|uniref:Translation initiation factor IF-3 n=1 Tax=Haloferula rosea TaxID=490093 RepID=A0A934RAT9_9BACT|nr:translation initiation factor IF-3 [Haloferula rosea]MBK1826363.1 translation initiation factor IF-3 [Haloferula rosea]
MTRVNERIRAPRVRVVLPDGQQLGVMSSKEALEKAKMVGLDLVEIAAKADPPVCRIIDYGKYKYEQAKLKKQQKTNTKNVSRMKEVKFRVRTEQHDYNIKLNRLETFLDEGHKARVILQFRGRENAHREIGFEKMERILKDLKTMANVDQPPRLSGRVIGMTLSPLPKEQRKRRFQLFHGELMDEDDFEDEEDGSEEEEVVSSESEDSEEEKADA